MVKDDDMAKLVDLYESRFNEFGDSPETVGWKDRATQELRFKELVRDLDLNGATIVDLGCGLGDFYLYLQAQGVKNFNFIGVDISEKLIDACKAKFPTESAQFVCQDIYRFEPRQNVDFTFCSGALSFKLEDNLTLAKTVLEKSFSYSEKGIGFNFLSSYVDYTLDKNFHYNPEELFKFCKEKLGNWVRLAHDYPLYEFTIQALKSHR